MRRSLARAAPTALMNIASTSSTTASTSGSSMGSAQPLPAHRIAARRAAPRGSGRIGVLRRPPPLPTPPAASTTNVRFPRLSMPGIDNALSSITSDIDAAEADGSLIDVTIRDVKAVSYVSRRRMDAADFDPDEVDEEGLPLVYNEERINAFWSARLGELAGRWATFAGISAPWLTRLATAVVRGTLERDRAALARDAVDNLEKLGPTYVKLGQILSIRPDVLPPDVMDELARLQDKIKSFSTTEARAIIEADLGQPIDALFSEFSEAPIAAASLAQVYRARLRSTGEEVAVKVQRPGALSTISKDLYVLRRAVGGYERLVRRFTAQTTDYQVLLSTFAEGLYTELDFRNEALNNVRMRELIDASEFAYGDKIVIPKPLLDLTTRRVLTMQWIEGVKLTTLGPEEIRDLVKVGQEAFLVQLLEIGFFHGDPHPGNLLKVTSGPDEGKLCLLDFGLVAEVPEPDREAMVSATIHLANRDWASLVDDFVSLDFLPPDCDRGVIIPVMDRVLSPYLAGGGAKAFNFQALSQDLLRTTLEIPFSVPPYMSLLARSIATLEGIALLGDPNYQMVAQAYPFVVRKVLRNSTASVGTLLRDIVFDASTGAVKPTRLSALLNAALGFVAERTDGFVDLDAVPEDGASLQDVVSFLLSAEARDLRPLLVEELVNGLDLWARDALRRAYGSLPALAPRLPFIGSLPVPPPPPVFVPGLGLVGIAELVDRLGPELDRSEEIYLQSAVQLAQAAVGGGLDDQEHAAASGAASPFLSSSSPSLISLVRRFLSPPSEQARELTAALASAAGEGTSRAVIAELADAVVGQLAERQAARLGVPVSVLFPGLVVARRILSVAGASNANRKPPALTA